MKFIINVDIVDEFIPKEPDKFHVYCDFPYVRTHEDAIKFIFMCLSRPDPNIERAKQREMEKDHNRQRKQELADLAEYNRLKAKLGID